MRASRTRTLIRTSNVLYLAGTDLIFPMKKNLPYPHVRLIEGNIPATVRWPPVSCLGGRNADRRPTDDQLTRSTNHAHSLTHTGKKGERKRRRIPFLWQHGQPTQHAVSGGREIIVPFRARQEGSSVGRFQQRHSATIFPPSSIQFSLKCYGWGRWRGRLEMAKNGLSSGGPVRGSFSKSRKAVSVTIAIGFELKP